jgi:hypothetical protein
VALEIDGQQLGRSCEKLRSVTYNKREEKYITYNRKKAKLTSCIGTAFERTIETMTAVTGRRRGKRKQFLIIVRKKEDAGN